MVQAPDAATLGLGGVQGIDAVEDLVRGEYNRGVKERMPRDFVTMYHPDGTSSIVQLPPIGKNGKGMGDRQRKVMHYMLNKKRMMRGSDGTLQPIQWWYPTKPEGWTPQPLPWRCPVVDCSRVSGLPDELQLYRHIQAKHAGDKELYAGVTKALVERLGGAAAMDLNTLRIEGTELTCDICDSPPPAGHNNPEAWLRGHKMGAHKESN